jgi:branched-chain amino acid transport system substrate-binding protein
MFEPAFPAFMKQLRAAGVDIPVIGAAGIDTPSVEAAGKDVEGVVLPSIGLESESPDLKKFNDELRQTAGDEAVTSYATRGYDLIKIIEAAVEKAGSTDPTKIRDAARTLKDVKGLSTTTTYDYEGGNGLPLIQPTYMVQIKNGKKVLVDTVELDPASVPKLEG